MILALIGGHWQQSLLSAHLRSFRYQLTPLKKWSKFLWVNSSKLIVQYAKVPPKRFNLIGNTIGFCLTDSKLRTIMFKINSHHVKGQDYRKGFYLNGKTKGFRPRADSKVRIQVH